MNNFYIITNVSKDSGYEFTGKLCKYITDKGYNCTYQKKETGLKYNYADVKRVPEGTECIIVLGGDGTLIQAARDLSSLNIAILGVNIGTLGFLTEIDMEQAYEAVDLLIKDRIYIDRRMIIEGSVIRDGKVIYSEIALNDIVLNRVGPLQIINFDIEVNGEFLISYKADGLIVATPTGSTAYNLSAGGPIIKPENDNIVVTPVCPHMLNKSSIIFDGKDELDIMICPGRNDKEERAVSFDGGIYYTLVSGDRIHIKKSDRIAKLIHIRKHNFLQILRNKMT